MKMQKFFVLVSLFFSCSSNNDKEEAAIELPEIQMEVLLWDYQLSDDKLSYTWKYEIKFFNNSPYDVTGYPEISHKFQGDNISYIPSLQSSNSCLAIASGQSCIVDRNETVEINPDVTPDPKPIELASAKYIVYSID